MSDTLRALVRRWHPVVDAAWRFEAGEVDAEAVKVAVRQQLRGGRVSQPGGRFVDSSDSARPATARKGEA